MIAQDYGILGVYVGDQSFLFLKVRRNAFIVMIGKIMEYAHCGLGMWQEAIRHRADRLAVRGVQVHYRLCIAPRHVQR